MAMRAGRRRRSPVELRAGDIELRLAESEDEIRAAQALRYRIFYEEMSAEPTPEMSRLRRDFDSFDDYCDHLLVIDHALRRGPRRVVGTYRLLRRADGGAARPVLFGRRIRHLARSWPFPARSWSSAAPASTPAIASARSCSCCGAASPTT